MDTVSHTKEAMESSDSMASFFVAEWAGISYNGLKGTSGFGAGSVGFWVPLWGENGFILTS